MSGTLATPGYVRSLFQFYVDPRGSVRNVLARDPSEATQIVLIMAACTIVLLARLVQVHLLYANPDDRLERSVNHIATQLMVLPLFYFAFAALVRLIAKAFGGNGTWRESRVAVFWSVLVSAPVMAASILLPLALITMPAPVLVLIAQFGGAFLAWALAQSIAETFGFTRTWLVFAVVCAPILTLFVLAWLLRS